jgi:hypothetical protein
MTRHFYYYLYLRNMSQRVRVGASFRKDCNATIPLLFCYSAETAPSEFNFCIAQYWFSTFLVQHVI